MLQIDWMKGSGGKVANYFVGADYFHDANTPSRWDGEYRQKLGLDGEVTYDDLKAALNNRTPDGRKITQRDAPDRRAALHLMFSAPKSVSIMEALAGDTRLKTVFDDSMMETMAFIARDAKRRVRAGGQDTNKITGNMVYAHWLHALGRPVKQPLLTSSSLTPVWVSIPDMQRHGHVVALNATYDKDEGKWYALDNEAIKKSAPMYQAFFRATLAKQIEALGYKLDYDKGDFEIHGITKEMRGKFSKRTQEVEDAIIEHGVVKAESKAKVGKMTREKKVDLFSMEQLKQIWASRLTSGELRTVRDTYLNSLGYEFGTPPDFSPKYTQQAIKELTQKDTWADERKVITLAMQRGIGKVSYQGVIDYLNEQYSMGGIVRRKTDRAQLSTKDSRLRQMKIEDLWKAGMGKHEKLGRDTYTVDDRPSIKAIDKKLMPHRDKYMSVRANIARTAAMNYAKQKLGAGTYKGKPPKEQVWFVESKLPDSEMLDVMMQAEERDARVVFWGDLKRSEVEQSLRLEPVELFDRKPVELPTNERLKKAVNYLIQRGKEFYETIRQAEQSRRQTPQYEH